MASPRKHIASRYLDSLNSENAGPGPLKTSSKMNQVRDLTPTDGIDLSCQTCSDSDSFEKKNDSLSPVKRLVLERESSLRNDKSPRAPLHTLNTNLEHSMAQLDLGSPSPLKRAARVTAALSGNSMIQSFTKPLATRKLGRGYEYLCRVAEAKTWIEKTIGETILPVTELSGNGLRDGVVLAELTKAVKPEFVKRIIPAGSKLQFKHTENINVFFKLLDYVKMPDIFRFELTDLYDKKNIPKVVFCIHALSFMLAQDQQTPMMEPLNGRIEFSDEEIKRSEGSLAGISLPNFESMHKQFTKEMPSKSLSMQTESTRSSYTENPFLEDSTNTSQAKSSEFTLAKKLEVVPHPLTPPQKADFGETLVERYNASPSKQSTLTESEYFQKIVRFQSIARGSIFRYTMFVDRIMLTSMSEGIVQLQSCARRALTLKKFRSYAKTMERSESNFITLQAIIRGKKQRSKIQAVTEVQPLERLIQLQSIARGTLIRSQVKNLYRQLISYDNKIVRLQGKIRGDMLRSWNQKVRVGEVPITNFQSCARRLIFARKINRSVHEAHSSEDAVSILQSNIRGNQLRSELNCRKRILIGHELSLIELQSIARGGINRSNLGHKLDIISFEENKIKELVAFSKGKRLRAKIQAHKDSLNRSLESIILVQSIVRGVLSRFNYDLFLDSIDYYNDETTALQACIRGFLHRKSKKDVMNYYKDHMPAIIKIQSFIRGKYLGSAYKSLISMPNPPLSVIKRFAYLLNDSDVDFEEELNLTRLKESINQKTVSNEQLERHIGQLDLKIALLQKNKITLDELITQKNKSVHPHHGNVVIDISSLNRRAKTRMELYEKLFYLLQTQPSYLARLMQIDSRGVDVALKIFHDVQTEELPTREEYLFIRLVEKTLVDYISRSQSVDDLQKQRLLSWQRLLRTFNETQVSFLQGLLGPLVQSIANDAELTMESDPVLIYRVVHNTPKTISVEKAIDDPETKSAFVSNLQQMREFGSEIFRVINDNIEKIPNFIRILAHAAYKASMKRFPHSLEQEHLASAGFVLINGFLNLVLEVPELFNIYPSSNSENFKKNVHQVSKLLIQLFLMKPFGADDFYLKPLNKFINSSVDGVRSLIKSIIEVSEIDSVYNMSVYDDMTAHNRPKVTLRVSDMIAIEQLMKSQIDLVAPSDDDILREIMVELQSTSPSDISKLHGHFTLSLNPSSYRASPEDSRVKGLFMQAKRCVLYLIQVQDDQDDLFELLKSAIDPIHEIKFKQIVNAENRDIQNHHVNEYVNDGQGFLGDLNGFTYHKLKLIALERILELESINKVSRYDSFQILLNEIAHDIRTKHDQRISRKKQLSIAENALTRLDEKQKFLDDQLRAYNIHIDKSMEELQSKPNKHKRIMPFTKQFFYERELKKSGNMPKFGAYKYSSKRLYEKGILIDLRGLNQDLGSSGSHFFGGFAFPKIDFMFNCDQPGIFTIASKSGTLAVNGSLEILTIDQLLEYQFENKQQISLFDGMAKFDTNCLINLIFKKFYHFSEA